MADFLIERAVDGGIILQQAEEAMLSAVDSLNGAKFGTAINQMRDALRFLMEARETVQQGLLKAPPKTRAAARQFDRLQRQKLRRDNEKAETLPQIAEELAKLAGEEDEVARTIAGPGNNPTGMGNAPEPKPMTHASCVRCAKKKGSCPRRVWVSMSPSVVLASVFPSTRSHRSSHSWVTVTVDVFPSRWKTIRTSGDWKAARVYSAEKPGPCFARLRRTSVMPLLIR